MVMAIGPMNSMINSHFYSSIGLAFIAYVNPLTHSSTVPLLDDQSDVLLKDN